MSKPTVDALWSTTGTKVEPSAGVKAAGWAVNQRPPAQWLNFWMNAVYQWIVWLAAFESTQHTWTAPQIHTAFIEANSAGGNPGVITSSDNAHTMPGLLTQPDGPTPGAKFYGGGGVGNQTGAVFPLDVTAFTTDRAFKVYKETALDVIDVNSNQILGDIYGFIHITKGVNADGLSTLGGLEVNSPANIALDAARFVGNTVASVSAATAVLRNTADATSRCLRIYKALVTGLQNPDTAYKGIVAEIWGAIRFSGANPSKLDVATENEFNALKMVKKSFTVTLDGTSTPGGSATSFDDGDGIASITQSTGGGDDGRLSVAFSNPAMADTNYRVIMICESNPMMSAQVVAGQKAGGFVKFDFIDVGTGGTALNHTTSSGLRFSCIIIGRQ